VLAKSTLMDGTNTVAEMFSTVVWCDKFQENRFIKCVGESGRLRRTSGHFLMRQQNFPTMVDQRHR